jgi:hypothetical protein
LGGLLGLLLLGLEFLSLGLVVVLEVAVEAQPLGVVGTVGVAASRCPLVICIAVIAILAHAACIHLSVRVPTLE